MRLKLASVLLVAGTVVGCASNPPPPPPMAAAPEAPPPAPMPMAPMAGTYRGMAEVAGGTSYCRPPKGMQMARVRGNTIMLAGMRGMIGPDGTVTGKGISGTVHGGSADVTTMRGKCSYHYTLNNSAAGSMPSSSSSMPSSTMPSTGSSM